MSAQAPLQTKEQHQGSTLEQLYLALPVLYHQGLYDAADFIKREIECIEKKNIWGFHPNFPQGLPTQWGRE